MAGGGTDLYGVSVKMYQQPRNTDLTAAQPYQRESNIRQANTNN
jgi:hypothetical protein